MQDLAKGSKLAHFDELQASITAATEKYAALGEKDDSGRNRSEVVALIIKELPVTCCKDSLGSTQATIKEKLQLFLPIASCMASAVHSKQFFFIRLHETRSQIQILVEQLRDAYQVYI